MAIKIITTPAPTAPPMIAALLLLVYIIAPVPGLPAPDSSDPRGSVFVVAFGVGDLVSVVGGVAFFLATNVDVHKFN